MGRLIPGIGIGNAPKSIPNKIPKNTATRLGSLSLLISLPKISPTLLIEAASPTTVSLSPICSVKLGDANRSIPARFTRVMLIPYKLRKRSVPNFIPFTLSRVTMMRRETS